jgi:hypothetical protein
MSLMSLAEVAVERDSVARNGDGQGGDDQSGLASATAMLVHTVPTEVLAPYTALIAVIIATIGTSQDHYESLRWWLYGVTTGLVIITLLVAFLRASPGGGRRFPLTEITTATIAFAAWGLVMPGSPLSLDVSGSALTISTATIAIAGAFLITLISPTLAKPSSKAPVNPPPNQDANPPPNQDANPPPNLGVDPAAKPGADGTTDPAEDESIDLREDEKEKDAEEVSH